MAAKSLEAQVRHQPRVAIIDLHGEINAFAEDVLNKAYAEAESRRAEVILLNFSDVDYINSTGIALIVNECSPGQSNNQYHRYSWRCLGIRGKCTDGGLCRGQYSNHSHHHLKFCGAGVYEQ